MRHNNPNERQFTVTGRVKPTRHDTETISFSFHLNGTWVTCIANIPDEGKNEAPVYVKVADGPRDARPNREQDADPTG